MSYEWAIRVGVGAAAVIAAVMLLLVASEAPSEPQQCMDERTREDMRSIALKALDSALEHQVEHLFEVWMRDPADQPRRAKIGTQTAVSAYLRARTDTLTWDPPLC